MKNSNENEKNEKPKQQQTEKTENQKLNEKFNLAFDPEKHDQKVETRLSAEAQSKARAIISRHFQEWKRTLQRASKKGTVKTKQDLIKTLYDLHGVVAKEASAPEMFEWRSFTMELLEDKIGEIIQTDGWNLNLFTEFIPEAKVTDGLTVPQRHTFETLEDFLKIPFLASFQDKLKFLGFVRDQRVIYGFFKDGELVRAGVVAQIKGLEQLPTKFEIEKALKENPPEDAP